MPRVVLYLRPTLLLKIKKGLAPKEKNTIGSELLPGRGTLRAMLKVGVLIFRDFFIGFGYDWSKLFRIIEPFASTIEFLGIFV